ncbi:MAG TPA: hypothetical protein DD401_07070 [Prevotella sp.]|nr:hypothetical protein [Prevotella sp.]
MTRHAEACTKQHADPLTFKHEGLKVSGFIVFKRGANVRILSSRIIDWLKGSGGDTLLYMYDFHVGLPCASILSTTGCVLENIYIVETVYFS